MSTPDAAGLLDPSARSHRARNVLQLVWFLTGRDLIVRYRGSVLGIFWSLVTPAATLAIYALVFGVLMEGRWGATETTPAEFTLLLFLGLIVFWLISESVAGAPRVIAGHPSYVKKVVFPLEVLPVIAVSTATFHTVVRFLVFVLAYRLIEGNLHATVLWAPVILAPAVLLCLGLSWALAAAGVFLRDLNEMIGVALTGLLFLSPVFYSADRLPESLRWALYLNPVTVPVEELRRVAIWGQRPDLDVMAVYAVVCLGVALSGRALFQRARRGFADVL